MKNKIKIVKSFKVAFSGLFFILKNERNFKIQSVAFASVCLLGFYFEVSRYDWIVLLLTSTLVLVLEIINTSLEKLCDVVQPNFHPKIMLVKDLAAAAVLWASIISVILGGLVFQPYIFV